MGKQYQAPADRKLRPSERVRDYLQAQVRQGQVRPGDRLPTTQELARELNVSSATVKNVFQQLSREGRVRTMVGNGSFWDGDPDPVRKRLVIGINYAPSPSLEDKPIGQNWAYRIYGGLATGSLESDIPISLRPFGVTATGAMEEPAKIELDLAGMDGVFLLFPHHQRLLRIVHSARRPAVSLNPVREMDTADFVSPDYHGSARMIGRVWRESGRRSILAVLAPAPAKSISIRQRLSGLLGGLGFGVDPDLRFRMLELVDGGEDRAYREVARCLAGGERPDGIFCAGDGQAVGVCQALKEAGISVPRDCSVIGGNGIIPHTRGGRSLTRIMHPLEQLGEEGIRMLITKIEHSGVAVPGQYLACPIIAGETTPAGENRRFEELEAEARRAG